ncbi:MAG: hypothetical protein FWG03_09060 [Clostridiales bacterium]|nr:hypothetical protein [Clostridiales bacterium]
METEILQQILGELKELKTGQSRVEAGQAKLKEDFGWLRTEQSFTRRTVSGLEDGQAAIRERLSGLEEGQTAMQERLSGLEEGQTAMQERLSGLEAGQAKLEAGQTVMQERLSGLEEGQIAMQESISKLEQDVSKIQQNITHMDKDIVIIRAAGFKLEQEYGKKIDASLGVSVGNMQKLTQHDKDIERIDSQIDRMDNIQIGHTLQLERLAK